ncbi:MAG: sensor histidine kinase [Rickettsiaceae bacterium H1]|nr:sensor histidine kinase [Rickettsiaceae bacterium H1]
MVYTKYNKLLFSLNKNYAHDHKHHILPLDRNQIYEDEEGNLTSVLPIYSDNNAIPDAVMELKYKSSFFMKHIDHIYLSYFISITILIVISLAVIYYILLVNRNALQKQYDVNVKLKIAKENAEENNVKKSIFLANISHELKTPLNSIIGFSQLIKENPKANVSNYLEYINEIHNSGVHLLSLINDILDFSKTEVNKLSIQNNLFDLNKVLESSLKMIAPRAKKHNLQIDVKVPNKPTIIKADARRMKQIFLNLLSNSLKFTKENGKITVSITKQIKNIVIIIKDTGIGIADKDLAQAMSTFGQTDNNLSRKYEGTGIGLPLSKNLIELMGGTFQIQSKEKYGTKITITFSVPKS